MVGRSTRMSKSGRDALPDAREWSGCPPGLPEVVRKPSQMLESGREAHSDVREWSGGLPGCPGMVERVSQMSRIGQKTHLDVRERSGGPFRCLGVVGRPPQMSLSSGRSYWMSGSCKEACQVSGSGQEALPDVWNGLGGSPECPGVVDGTYG